MKSTVKIQSVNFKSSRLQTVYNALMRKAVLSLDRRRVNALLKAAQYLNDGGRYFTLTDGTVLIPSASTDGLMYKVWKEKGVWVSDCAASKFGQPSWHTAFASLLECAGVIYSDAMPF